MIDRSSYGALAIIYAFCLVLGFVFVRFVRIPWIVWPMIGVLIWLAIWQTSFFWVPKRCTAGSDRRVSSVAQGRVILCEKSFEQEYLKRDCLLVSVYMNFFDIHSNFWPVDGTISWYKYTPGEHFLAFEPKTSIKNEHSCVCITTCDGHEVLFKQIAGGFARRIVTSATVGQKVKAGEQCGIIKFGSRIDMFLPLDADIKVKKGDLVRCSDSLIAILRPSPCATAQQS